MGATLVRRVGSSLPTVRCERTFTGLKALNHDRLTQEVLEREPSVLAEKIAVDLDANTLTRLHTNHAPDHSDFFVAESDEEGDL